jgi:hypothetical protein
MPKEKRTHMVVKPIPVPLGSEHPEPRYPELPTHEFTMGFIAPKVGLFILGGWQDHADL